MGTTFLPNEIPIHTSSLCRKGYAKKLVAKLVVLFPMAYSYCYFKALGAAKLYKLYLSIFHKISGPGPPKSIQPFQLFALWRQKCPSFYGQEYSCHLSWGHSNGLPQFEHFNDNLIIAISPYFQYFSLIIESSTFCFYFFSNHFKVPFYHFFYIFFTSHFLLLFLSRYRYGQNY